MSPKKTCDDTRPTWIKVEEALQPRSLRVVRLDNVRSGVMKWILDDVLTASSMSPVPSHLSAKRLYGRANVDSTAP